MINRTFDSNSTEIRLAQLDDAPAISELVNQSYRGETGAQGWTTEAHLLTGLRTDGERVRSLISTKNSAVLIKTVGENLEGCVHLEVKNKTTAYLGMLTTNFQSQAKGTGSELLSFAEHFAKDKWAASIIEMTVITLRTELLNWYVRRGYQVTNEKRAFPTDPRFGIPLVKNLEFVVLTKSI